MEPECLLDQSNLLKNAHHVQSQMKILLKRVFEEPANFTDDDCKFNSIIPYMIPISNLVSENCYKRKGSLY